MNILNNGLLFGPILGGGRRTNGYRALSLDFAAQSYAIGGRPIEDVQQLLTVKRATPKWVYNSSGQLVEIPANEPAYQYDPVAGEPLGVSIEEARTNYVPLDTYSIRRHEILEMVESPLPGHLARRVSTTFAGGNVYSFAGFAGGVQLTSGQTIVHSIYAKATGTNSTVRVGWYGGAERAVPGISAEFDLSSGTVLQSGSDAINSGIEPAGGGWYRCWISAEATQDGEAGCCVWPQGGFGDETIWGLPQVEKDATRPSSYIPVTDSPVTREADSIHKPLGDEYNPNGFSVYAEAQQNSDTGSVIFLNNGGLSNSIRVGVPTNGDRAMYVTVDGSIRAFADLSEFPNYTKGDPAKIVLAVDPSNNRIRLTINGETVENHTSRFPSLDEIKLGGVTGKNNNINGTIHDCIMYQTVITASEAEEMTS